MGTLEPPKRYCCGVEVISADAAGTNCLPTHYCKDNKFFKYDNSRPPRGKEDV